MIRLLCLTNDRCHMWYNCDKELWFEFVFLCTTIEREIEIGIINDVYMCGLRPYRHNRHLEYASIELRRICND